MRKIIIGSRESKLAVVQSEMVKKAIEDSHEDIEVEIYTMKTTGIRFWTEPWIKSAGKDSL